MRIAKVWKRKSRFSVTSVATALLALVSLIDSKPVFAQVPDRIEIEQERIEANGIRRIRGSHLDVYTDLPSAEDVDELPDIFDQAVPQWCSYFNVDPKRTADWKVNCFLILDKDKFEKAGLLHSELPPFLNGYQEGHQFWMFEQPSPFFRRHLMLHEGTHAFMNLIMGGAGPPWYLEGMAELLGCHRWQAGKLTIDYRIASREESPYWGRVKIIKDAVQAGTPLSLQEVLFMEQSEFLKTNAYGWAWAATAFFDGHPAYRDRFHKLQANVRDRSKRFTQQFMDELAPDWSQVVEQWQLFLAEMDYGYDVERAAVSYLKKVEPIPEDGILFEIASDRGWQSSGLRVEAGQKLLIRAQGRYQVAKQPSPWWCEPDGVTIQYYRGKPLGALLVAVRDELKPLESTSPLVAPTIIGSRIELEFEGPGTLFFRINESPASLADNQGELKINIRPQ